MDNKNSLISLAYIKINENPLHVFCNYILYLLLKSPGEELRADLLQDGLQNEFGINMPQQLINNCIRILEKNNEISRLQNGGGYKISETKFDLEGFERKRLELHSHEDRILCSIIRFVKVRFRKEWTKDDARKYLSEFMDKEGYGAQLFLRKEIKVKDNRVSPNFYIGRYIDSIRKDPENIENVYLEEIVNGIMILQGLCLTRDYSQNKNRKFKGTVFYFDTKLVLRALGFSWEAQVRSVREMVRLLRDKYGAKIGIFSQTLKEVENALLSAGSALEKKQTIWDEELKLYSELYPEKASLMMERSTNIMGLLKRELGVDEIPNIDWDTSDAKNYNIDIKNIADYIEEQCGWRRGAIDFDVEILNQINILRKADYSDPYGGKRKLPVFVTSNSKLVYTFRNYILENEDNSKDWSTHALPVISDNMLLYRIWLPFASESSKMPSLTLARFAYAAQSEGREFFEKIRQKASEMESIEHIDLISMPEVARRKFEDILIAKSDGDPELLDNEVVAVSYDECLKMAHLNLLHERNDYKDQAEKFKKRTVELLSKKYIDKLGLWKVLLILARWWWIPSAIVLYVVSEFITQNTLISNAVLTFTYKMSECFRWTPQLTNLCITVAKYFISLIPIFVYAFQFLYDKRVDDKGLRFSVYKRALQYVKNRYIKKIKIDLRSESCVDDVVLYCLEHTKEFANIH